MTSKNPFAVLSQLEGGEDDAASLKQREQVEKAKAAGAKALAQSSPSSKLTGKAPASVGAASSQQQNKQKGANAAAATSTAASRTAPPPSAGAREGAAALGDYAPRRADYAPRGGMRGQGKNDLPPSVKKESQYATGSRRVYDHHLSGTGRPPTENKKGGAGGRNWGKPGEELAGETDADPLAEAPATKAEGDAPAEEADASQPREPDARGYDEYLKQLEQKKPAVALPAPRKANEGADDPEWAGLVPLKKDGESDTTKVVAAGDKKQKQKKTTVAPEQVGLQVRHADEGREREGARGGRGGRGGRGRGGDNDRGRRSPQGGRGGASSPGESRGRGGRGGRGGGGGGGRGASAAAAAAGGAPALGDDSAFPSLGNA